MITLKTAILFVTWSAVCFASGYGLGTYHGIMESEAQFNRLVIDPNGTFFEPGEAK